MKSLSQRFAVPFSYEVLFTEHLFSTDNPILKDILVGQASIHPIKVLFVIDEGVAKAHPELIDQIYAYTTQYHNQLVLTSSPLIIEGGEGSKNDYGIVEKILEAINEYNICRHSYVIGVGGGAVLDVVGFAAGIAHRGVRHIRIPTTVLSQNDSGVGVKNGVNFFGKKNFIGSFTPPVAVINDITFLRTLDDRDWRSGIAEAIKVALIKDEAFFMWLEANASSLAQRDNMVMQELIYRCAELHMEHISGGDPFEKGSSRPLDFGHWAAHKLEQLTNYDLRHGEAVAIGIALDVVYSKQKGMLSASEADRVISLIRQIGFSLFHEQLLAKVDGQWVILKGLDEFREHLGGQLTVMLLEKIGRGVNVHEMDAHLVQSSIQELCTLQQVQVLNPPSPEM